MMYVGEQLYHTLLDSILLKVNKQLDKNVRFMVRWY